MARTTTDESTCRYPTCSNTPRDDLTGREGRFCSTKCELKYEHARQDANDARRAVENGDRPY